MMERRAFIIVASLLLLLAFPRMPPASAAADDMNLTGLIYLSSGTSLGTTQWANNTTFAVYVDHTNDWSVAWRYPPWPQWYTTSMGAYSIVLPASEKDMNWSNGDWYRVQVDASIVFDTPSLLLNATSNGTGDPGEFTPFGSRNNSISWSVADNWQRWDIVVGGMPDLIPRGLDVAPSPPMMEGTMSRINVTVSNEGDLPAAAFDVLLYDDRNGNKIPDTGEQVDLSSSSGLAGHSQSEYIFDWNATPTGLHSICAYADPSPGTVIESNESNNVVCIDVLVQPGPILRPDYVPISPLPLPPIRVGMSSQVSLSVQVLNQGNGTATDDATVAFYEQSSPPFSSSVLNPLAPATTSSRFTATWMSLATPDTYIVSVDVDYAGNLTEWDETNNVYAWTIEVVSGPVTSLVIGNPNYTSPAMATYVRSTTPLDFHILDQSGLGIRNTTYTIDGGSPVNYTAAGTFFLAGEGQHTIEWQSLDWAGNLEQVNSFNLTVDDTPPATTIHQSEEQATTATLFTLTATDLGCGVNVTKYRIDGGNRITYSGGFTLSEGEHNISFLSNDLLNNTEVEKWLVVTVEGTTTPPEVEVNYKPIVAVAFAIIMLVAGFCSSRRRPWRDGKNKMAVAKAFAIISLPFILAEAGTGIVSYVTGELSMPPFVGVGMAIDLAILIAGLTACFLRGRGLGLKTHPK